MVTTHGGSALSNLFGLCGVVHFYGGEVPAEAGYRPGPCVELELEAYPDAMFAEMSDDGTVGMDDLTYWIRVLSRYVDLVPEDRRY